MHWKERSEVGFLGGAWNESSIVKTCQLFYNRLNICAHFKQFANCFPNDLHTRQLSCIIIGTHSIDENWQGPVSMAYISLLSSNEQLFLVEFHLGYRACILCNL